MIARTLTLGSALEAWHRWFIAVDSTPSECLGVCWLLVKYTPLLVDSDHITAFWCICGQHALYQIRRSQVQIVEYSGHLCVERITCRVICRVLVISEVRYTSLLGVAFTLLRFSHVQVNTAPSALYTATVGFHITNLCYMCACFS